MRRSARTKYQRPKYQQKKRKIRRQQHGRFLNWYYFAYGGRDTINQAINCLDLLVPKLIGQTSKEIDKIAKVRIKQIMNQGGSNSKNNSTNH